MIAIEQERQREKCTLRERERGTEIKRIEWKRQRAREIEKQSC